MMVCRVMLELSEGEEREVVMRWERSGECADAGPFVLLGRAFEVAQRETGGSFVEALSGFFQGAMIQREDVLAALRAMEGTAPKSE